MMCYVCSVRSVAEGCVCLSVVSARFDHFAPQLLNKMSLGSRKKWKTPQK